MGHLWRQFRGGEWRRIALEDGAASLVVEGTATPAAQVLHACPPGAPPLAVLEVLDPALKVNGEPVLLPLRVLADRDEILLPDGGLAYYSTERQAVIVPLPASAGEVCCARCRQPIAPGTPVVACPGCGAYHHQTDEFPCWIYSPRCALCDQDTALDAPFRFNPEEF